MTAATHPLILDLGLDRRSLSTQTSDYYAGHVRWGDINAQNYQGVPLTFSIIPNDVGTYSAAIRSIRPWVVTTTEYTTDNLGQTFPAGTVFLACPANPTLFFGFGKIRLPGNSATTINLTLGNPNAPVPFTMMYRVAGVPAGASGVITITQTSVTIATVTVSGANGAFQTIAFADITPGGTDPYIINAVWTGGVPNAEMCAPSYGPLVYFAVPSTLPAGFTPVLDAGLGRGGSFQGQYHADRTRFPALNNISFALLGIAQNPWNPDMSFGCIGDLSALIDYIFSLDTSSITPMGIQYYNAWVGGSLQALNCSPMALNDQTLSFDNLFQAITTWSPVTTTQQCLGFRYTQIAFNYFEYTQAPQVTDVLTVTVKSNGVTIFTGTYTGSQINAPPATVSIGAILPAIGSPATVTIDVEFTGALSPFAGPYWQMDVVIGGSPRVDIPFPFSCVGPGNAVAPGGYVPSLLTAPLNNAPLVYVTPGAQTYDTTVAASVGFTVPLTGWWEIMYNGFPLVGIGMDIFQYRWIKAS